MSEIPLWFERKFHFDFPVEVYPNLCARLRGTPARVEEITRGLSRELLTHKPDGKWSVQENAGHLADLEELWIARLDDYLAGKSELAAADLQNRKTHQANHNARALAQILQRFRALRTGFVERLDGLRADDFARVARHPRLHTPLRLVDHLHFVAEHDDHHLARIWELRGPQG